MTCTVPVRHEAEIDIEEAAFWYEKQREGLGDEFLDEIQHTLSSLLKSPYPTGCSKIYSARSKKSSRLQST